MEIDLTKRRKIRKLIAIRFVMFFLILCLLFFLPAKTFNFWEAWVYIGIIFPIAAVVIWYFSGRDPEFLERRMRTREKLKEQKKIIGFGWILFMPIFIIPGFDHYYGWSQIPLYLIILSDILVLAGYIIVFRVFIENSYASRIIEVDSNQKVITTGPYALVRHPMYSGVLLMYGFTPLALGSWWALIGSFFLLIIIIARIFSEEKFLLENLAGYKEYYEKIRYRIIPGIW